MLKNLQISVVTAAFLVCENAAILPDGNAQVPVEFTEKLGEALVALGEFERELYKDYLQPLDTPVLGLRKQQGLNSAQVALQRLTMNSHQLYMEKLLDLSDQIYLGFFDEVIIPGFQYSSLPKSELKEVRFVPKELIEEFQSFYA